jgi:hypothetical protein
MIDDAPDDTIGGTTAGKRNVIALEHTDENRSRGVVPPPGGQGIAGIEEGGQV